MNSTEPTRVLKSTPARLKANHKYYESHRPFILKIAKDYYDSHREAIKIRKRNKYLAMKAARLETA